MTDWNQRYLSGDTPWEKGSPAPPLLELLEKVDRDVWGSGTILVPGCGTGHDVRALAGNGLEVLGLDLAEKAIILANSHPKSGNETYELGDFLNPEWQQGKSFSAIWEHTCFCAIDPSCRPEYAQACAALIPPGGHLIGVFFLNPYDPGEETPGPPFGTSMEELDAHFSQDFQLIDSWQPRSAYPGREGRELLAIYLRK